MKFKIRQKLYRFCTRFLCYLVKMISNTMLDSFCYFFSVFYLINSFLGHGSTFRLLLLTATKPKQHNECTLHKPKIMGVLYIMGVFRSLNRSTLVNKFAAQCCVDSSTIENILIIIIRTLYVTIISMLLLKLLLIIMIIYIQ